MTIDYRPPAGPDEVQAAFEVFLRSMIGLDLPVVDASTITENGRYIAAFEGDAVVGGVDSYSGWLAVPGGARIPHAAVTHVGVLPTHRRKGIVRNLITRQLHDIAARGEIVATLRASEAVIYERFGYGIASAGRSVVAHRRRIRLRDGVPAGGKVRLVDGSADTHLLRSIADQADWPGAIARPAGWWTLRRLATQADPTRHLVAVHSTGGVDDGYVVYRPENTQTWFTDREKTITVTDFIATNDTARAGLWRHLFSLDLVDRIVFEAVALDDPLQLAVTDERALELGPARDETWLRLVDVERALAGRTYGRAEPVVLAVVDAQIDANNAAFEVGPDAVRRSAATPDLTVDVATLATAYLGGTRWRQLAAAGRVDPGRAEVISRLDVLFGVDRLPFSGTAF